MTTPQEDYEKDLNTLKKLLRDAEYVGALHALEFAEEYHPGFRKDGETPNFHHQVGIGFTLYDEREMFKAAGLGVDTILTLGILHDTIEDNKDLPLSAVEGEFDERIASGAWTLSKVRNGKKIPTEQYYEELLGDPLALIVKLHDRRSNVETIANLPPEKQRDYVIETWHLLDVAKRGSELHPELNGIIQHSRRHLKSCLKLYLAVEKGALTGATQEAAALLQKSGLIHAPNAPRPNSAHAPLPRPAGPAG